MTLRLDDPLDDGRVVEVSRELGRLLLDLLKLRRKGTREDLHVCVKSSEAESVARTELDLLNALGAKPGSPLACRANVLARHERQQRATEPLVPQVSLDLVVEPGQGLEHRGASLIRALRGAEGPRHGTERLVSPERVEPDRREVSVAEASWPRRARARRRWGSRSPRRTCSFNQRGSSAGQA